MDDPSQADIGIVCALPMEASPFLARCDRVRTYTGRNLRFRGGLYDGIRIVVVEAGAGIFRAKRGVQALVDGHQPRWILSVGFGGGLIDGVRIGDIVVPHEIHAPGRAPIHIDLKMPADPTRGLHTGPLVTVDHIVRAVEEKRALASEHGAILVDMETHAIAEFCRDKKHRFLSVRVCSDDLANDLPPEVLSLMGETGAIRWGAVFGSLLKRPSSMQDMWKLREQANIAATRLANFLDGVVKQLHASNNETPEPRA